MKGLIIKDILNLKNYMKQLILVLIFFIAYGIFLKNGTFVGTMITLMLSMQVITTMSDIVLSKYVFFIMSIIIGMVVGVISSTTINQILQSDINMNEIIATSIVVPCIFAILFSIVIPVVFKNGVEKGRIVMMIVLFIPAVLVAAIVKISENNNIPMPNVSNLEMILNFGLLGVILLTIISIFMSYKISLSIYNKKEF